MKTRLAIFLTILIVFWTGFINIPTASALPATGVNISGASDVLIGTSPIPLTITFDNTAPNGAGNTGYAPFLDVYFPASGVDGATAPVDGLDYIPLSATYLGEPVTETILTFPVGPLGGACAVTESAVAHPYLPVSVCGQPNDTLVVFLLPLASLTPDQPPIVLELNASLSNFADADVPLTLYARGGYRYDAPVAGNPFLSDATPATMTDNPTFSITPRIVTLTKTNTVTEAELVTGPNSPHTYTITTTVAPGQTITNYDIFDYIDDNIVVVGIVAPGASVVTLGGLPAIFPAGPVVANGTANRVVLSYPSITGTVSATISYFIPLRNAGGASIIPATNGASLLTSNRVNSIGDFDPLDPRDPAGTNNALGGDINCPACLPTISHSNRSIYIQKSVTNLSGVGNTPGDILQYTLNIAVSDFFALDNAFVFDVISDGQRLNANPTISYTQHGITVGGAMTNFVVREYFTGGAPGVGGLPDPDVPTEAGDTVLAMDLSAELAIYGYNELLGGCVPVGGTGAGDPDCNIFNAALTTMTITYQTAIQDAYTDDFPSTDASLDMADTIDNLARVQANTVLNTANLAPTGVTSSARDTSTISLTSGVGSFTKEIIAVNGGAPVGIPTIYAGDAVTFRLRMTLPSSDFENLSISDFLPAPVFNATSVTTFNNAISDGSNTTGTGIPTVGNAMWGATGVTDGDTNFATIGGAFTPTIVTPGNLIPASCGGGSLDANENTLLFCFGDYDSPANTSSTIDILFTAQAQASNFPNNFVAGNFARTSISSTQNNSRAFDDLTRMILGAGVVTATKTIDGTSEAHTNDLTADTPADPRPVAIGEVITYRLVVELPEGTAPDVQFTDTLASNIEFIAGSARVSYSANNAFTGTGVYGINELNPTTAIPAGQISFGVTSPRELRFDLGEVINNDSDPLNTELLIVEYDVVVVNTADNVIGGTFVNRFEVDVNNDGTDEAVSNDVSSIVQEPVITILKSINTTLSIPAGTTNFDGGDTVVYDILVVAGNGANMTTAFDLTITDAIDPDLDLIAVDFIGTPLYATTADNSDYVMPVQTVSATITELRTGDSITIRVTATVRNTVTIGQIIPNTGGITWTSLPGNRGTNNATPGNSGDTNGERNGNTVGENDYIASNTVNVTVTGTVNTNKTIDGTSEAHTNDLTADTPADPRPVAIGEVMTYRLVVELPEGTSPDVQFTDTLASNVEFIAGSARVSYSANNAFTGAGVYGINELNPTTAVPAGQISFGVTAPRELRFDLGQVVNNDNDNTVTTELLIVEYDVVVVNTSDNAIGTTFANRFEVDVNNDGTDEAVSNDVSSIVQEPVISATKAIFGTPPASALDIVTYDITITAGNGVNQQNAYDMRVLDVLNPDLFLDSVTIQTNPGYVSITADNNTYVAGGTVDITLNRLQAGDSVTIRVVATVLPSVTAGETIGNTATITWTSLPGTGSATPGASGDSNGERNGSAIGENDHTFTTPVVNFTLASTAPLKTIDATSETGTPETGDGSAGNERLVAIGEIVTYRLNVVLPESTTISFSIEDTLPIGVQFVAGSARVSYSADTLPSFNGDFGGIQNELNPTFLFPASRITITGDDINFDFGSIINNDADANIERIFIEFDVVVLDDGVNINGDRLGNDFELRIDEGLPTEVIIASNEVFIQIAEPALTMTKTFTPDVQVRGGTTTMTIVVSNLASNGATAPIHDLQVTDILDDWLDVTGVTVTFNATATTFGSTFVDNSVIAAGFATGVTDNLDIAISGLPIDGEATITVTLDIDPNADPVLLPRTITNTADMTGDSLATDITPDDQDRAYSTNATDDLTIVLQAVDIEVLKTVVPLAIAQGGNVTYTVTVTNLSTITATGVEINEDLPLDGVNLTYVSHVASQGTFTVGTPSIWNIGTLTAGQSVTLDLTATVEIAGGQIINTASLSAINELDGNPANDSDTATIEVGANADLSLTKTVSDNTPQVGDVIVYTLIVTNAGPDSPSAIAITDTLPPTVTYAGIHTPSQGTFDGAVWTVGALGVGDSAQLDISVTVNGNAGTTTNIAEITASDLPDPDSIVNNGVTTEDDYAEVAFLFDPPFGRKTFNDAGLPELEWTVVWVNPSNAPIAVTMSDPLLGGTTFVAGSLTCTSLGTLTVNTCIYDAVNNEIVFDGTIFPDVGATPATIDSATNRLIITYRVAVPADVTSVSNVATLNSPDGAVAVSTAYNRPSVNPEQQPPTTSTSDATLLETAKALPATGEAPMWADTLRHVLLILIPVIVIGVGGYWLRRRRMA